VLPVGYSPARNKRCTTQPLFTGAASYGPADLNGPAANPYFDFRTVAAAEVLKVGQRYYMLYEGVRGPGPGEPGNSQFALGLARSVSNRIDGAWEKFGGNPILLDLPGNIGVGHADVLQMAGQTWLYTTLADGQRSRYPLAMALARAFVAAVTRRHPYLPCAQCVVESAPTLRPVRVGQPRHQ
jgi:hypothetical protein